MCVDTLHIICSLLDSSLGHDWCKHRDCNVPLATALSSVILPNIRKCLGWLVTCSLGCSIKYILALLTIYFLKFHPYQLSLSSPDPITKSYSEFLPLSHYELFEAPPLGNKGSPPFRDISIRHWLFSGILSFVKYGIRPGPGSAFRN